MGAMDEITVRSRSRAELIEITDQVQSLVRRSGIPDGAVVLQSLHTTAGLTVNENADPDVAGDMVQKLGDLVQESEPYYRHAEGNSDSHVKTTLVGPSLTLIVRGGRVLLGRWQGIYLCEWDGPRERTVAVQVLRAG
jgi:secondary thiamine-phosphate synthase enzyme